MPDFDAACALRPDGEGRFLVHADADHRSINGMFGGWTAAVSLGAAVASGDPSRRPSALTVNYLGAIEPGTEVLAETSHLGRSRSLDHWRTDLRAADGSLAATALVVLTSRRDTDGHDQFAMPNAPDPESLEEFHAPSPQGLQTHIRPIAGGMGTGHTATTSWIRMENRRAVDHVQLAYLADQYAPRTFCWGDGPRPSATITMSVYFHATDEDLAAAGSDYLMNEAIGTRSAASTSGQHARLWSRHGVLLATTEQLAWYR